MSTRREFLLSCSALAATAAVTPSSMLAALPGAGEVSLDRLTVAALTEQIDTSFAVADRAGARWVLRLTAIQPFADGGAASTARVETARERFSLWFASDDAGGPGQDTHSFDHPRLGRFAMFIVPVGRPVGARSFYEAVFDRPAVAGALSGNREVIHG